MHLLFPWAATRAANTHGGNLCPVRFHQKLFPTASKDFLPAHQLRTAAGFAWSASRHQNPPMPRTKQF
jgi:hypothetical protein